MTDQRRHIVITRPEEDASALATDLAKKGFKPLLAPMLSIKPLADAEIDTRGIQGIMFTSSNGVRAFAKHSDRRTIPCWCVGSSTAATAREHGFLDIKTAGGDVDKLAEMVMENLPPGGGALLHASGSSVAGDLAGILSKAGYTVCRTVLYESILATEIPAETTNAMKEGSVRAILFFSPRTADSFVRLVLEAGLEDTCTTVDAVCLSEAVADSASRLDWANMVVSEQPTQPSLLEASEINEDEIGTKEQR